MSSVSAILLSAGESRRMGSVNKLLLPVKGVPLVGHVAKTLTESMIGELVVVLGHEAAEIERSLDGLCIRTVFNDRYREGRMTSLHAGLEALTREAEGIMVCLSDQPLLTVEDINKLIDCFRVRLSGDVVVPTYRGRRGNPVVFSDNIRRTILNGPRNLGCRHLIEINPEIVTMVEWGSDHVVVDVDTQEEYSRLEEPTAFTNSNQLETSPGRMSEKPHAK